MLPCKVLKKEIVKKKLKILTQKNKRKRKLKIQHQMISRATRERALKSSRYIGKSLNIITNLIIFKIFLSMLLKLFLVRNVFHPTTTAACRNRKVLFSFWTPHHFLNDFLSIQTLSIYSASFDSSLDRRIISRVSKRSLPPCSVCT